MRIPSFCFEDEVGWEVRWIDDGLEGVGEIDEVGEKVIDHDVEEEEGREIDDVMMWEQVRRYEVEGRENDVDGLVDWVNDVESL